MRTILSKIEEIMACWDLKAQDMDVRIFGSSRIEAVYQHHMYNFGFAWTIPYYLDYGTLNKIFYSSNQWTLDIYI